MTEPAVSRHVFGAHAAVLPQRVLRSAWLAGWPLVLAFAVPLLVFWLQKDVGFSFLDEGFAWYGAQRVMQGEVPLRDFQAYDIGRYYWYAGWMWLTGSDGLLPMRAGSAVLAGITVALAVRLVAAGRKQSAWAMALAVASFALWMVPYFKVADSFASLLLLTGVAGLATSAMPGRWFRYGVCLGLAAAIGINHALYGVVAGVLMLAWRRWQGLAAPTIRGLGAAGAGAALGYAPVLLCHLAAPGFTAAFVDSIRMLFEVGATNLGHPLSYLLQPWHDDGLPPLQMLRERTLSAALLLLVPAFGLCCVARLLYRGRDAAAQCNPVFVAAVVMAVADAHYVLSRPDTAHLAVSVLPLLVAAWTWPPRHGAAWPARSVQMPFGRGRTLALLAVFGLSGVLAAPSHGLWQLLRQMPLETVAVGSEVLRMSPNTAAELRFLQRLQADHAVPPRSMYVVPYWPGAYAALRLRSPAWEIYNIFPASAPRQRREIERLALADTTVAVVLQGRMDGRPELGFERTHPLIADRLARCMTRLSDAQSGRPRTLDAVVYVAGPRRCLAAP